MTKKNNWAASGFGKFVSPDMVEDRFLDSEIVILLQGTNLFGDLIYSYLKLKGNKLKEMFAKMQAGENFMPSDYGSVLAAGRGEPNKQVRDEMATTHNMLDVPMPDPIPQASIVQPKFFSDE